ncbi:heavy metal-associated isoprenylated plant protein 16-like [Rhododendron vialii]|uniref:heavy metal-associated isoprenylated plant protein 16-like n=1 Tax=Rhododendron vialii TaxID=182163 RepID=UPI00265E1CA1|nr:heavy metal-associated isoprenylated plant protein 16-like [Rhododendron vialii]
MPQKVVIKLHINGEKSRSKALQIVSGVSGIESLTWAGEDKNQIEVTGDGIDAAALTMLFRRKMGYSELVSVGPVPVPEDGGDQRENGAIGQIPVWGYYNYPYAYGTADMHEIRYQNPDNCSIM